MNTKGVEDGTELECHNCHEDIMDCCCNDGESDPPEGDGIFEDEDGD